MENKDLSIVNFEILNKIQDYIFSNEALSFRMLGFVGDIDLYGMRVPSSFDDKVTQNQLNNAKLKSAYHLFNIFNKKADLTELSKDDIALSMEQGSEYWYMHINFKKPLEQNQKSVFKYQSHTFLIVLYNSPGSDSLDSFKMLYSNEFFIDYVKGFSNAVYIDFDAELSDEHKKVLADLEIALGGICKQAGIEIPENLIPKNLSDYLILEIKNEDFEELLFLVSRGKIPTVENKKYAKSLVAKIKKWKKKTDEVPDDFKLTLEIGAIVEKYDLSYHSDWKFDPEDITYAISKMLGTDFTFSYPNETYSSSLFPYLQEELFKSNLELMTFDTQGDSYNFFLANSNDVEKILALAQKLRVGIEKIRIEK
jgi:hypothetical protein